MEISEWLNYRVDNIGIFEIMVPKTNIENILHRLDELTNELKSLSPVKPEYQKKLDEKFRMEFNYNSNHMEGNTLTYGETKVLLIFGDTSGNHNVREFEEMKAHDVAYKLVEEWAKDKEQPLTEQNIKNLNGIILVEPFWNNAITPDGQHTRRKIKIGDYKEFPNSVILQNGEMFDYASPIDTPSKMQELMEWYRKEESEMHPLELATLFHYQFVRIHPFDDGNGRIARLIMNYILLRNGLPPIVIKSDDKKNYLRVLHLADAGDLNPLVEYMGQQLEWSLDIYLKGAKGESIEEQDDLEKAIDIWKKGLLTDAKVVIPRSNELILEVFNHSLIPLFEMFFDKHQRFDELYTEKQITNKIDNHIHEVERLDFFYKWINYLERYQEIQHNSSEGLVKVSELTDLEFEFQKDGFNNSIREIEINLYYIGFRRNGVNTFNTSSGLKVVFNQFNYVVSHRFKQGQEYFKKLYSEKITMEEISQLVTELLRETHENIKASIK